MNKVVFNLFQCLTYMTLALKIQLHMCHCGCRCKRWVINCRTQSLDNKTVEELHSSYRLCSRHFEDSQFMNNARTALIWCAVPTIFDVPNPPHQLSSKCRRTSRGHHNDKAETEEAATSLHMHTYSAPVASSPSKKYIHLQLERVKRKLRHILYLPQSCICTVHCVC